MYQEAFRTIYCKFVYCFVYILQSVGKHQLGLKEMILCHLWTYVYHSHQCPVEWSMTFSISLPEGYMKRCVLSFCMKMCSYKLLPRRTVKQKVMGRSNRLVIRNRSRVLLLKIQCIFTGYEAAAK